MIYILLFIAFFASDMWVKNWAVEVLKEAGSMEVLPGLFALTYAENKGAAFSMLSGARWFFVVVAIVFLCVLYYMYRKNYFTNWWSKLGAVMIAAGTVGNAIDRLRYGFVVDMFEFLFIDFAIFNVADVFITVGAVFFLLHIFLDEMKSKREKEEEKIARELAREIENSRPEPEMETVIVDENLPEEDEMIPMGGEVEYAHVLEKEEIAYEEEVGEDE